MRKTFVSIAFIAIFFIAFTFGSCSRNTKEVVPTSNVSEQNIRSKNASTSSNSNGWKNVVIANVQNPLDSIGYHHNLALDYVIARRNPNKTIAELVTEYGCGLPTNIQNCHSTFLPIAQATLGTNLSNFDTSVLSAQGVVKYNELIALLSNIDENTFSLNDLQQDIIQWENSIHTLITTQNEKNLLFASGAVARHSAVYWLSELELEESAWFPNNTQTGAKRNWWKFVLGVIGADLTGCLAGMATSAAVGPLGAGVGAIIGGAGASCTAAAAML
jgi:hypothetical protein